MIDHYNAEITPVIYQLGSLGASGDLAPLSHMSLQLLGLGQVHYQGAKQASKAVIDNLGISVMKLSAKEGLALINGTQFSLAYGLYASYHSQRLMRFANLIAAMSLDAYNCMPDPFSNLLQNIRPQTGQVAVAESIRGHRAGSQILSAPKHNVQDPYSFRCIPQVHGASHDAIEYVSGVVERELNSVTDNPNIFPDEDQILSGGNFHAQALALPLDFLAIALSELSDISERRIFKLVNGDRELPQFLTPNPGLNSGFMIIQYTAASVVNQNKHLANPVSTDSIVSSRGQEDHVSMAANSATKIYRMIDNVYRVFAMELMCAAQALEFRGTEKSSKDIQDFHRAFRKQVKPLEEDREMYLDIETSVQFLKSYLI
jgi:histidine ammonia-lyase